MKGKGKHNNLFTSASTINNSVIAETKKTMISFLTVMSMGVCQGSERETQQCGCKCLVPSFPGKHRDQGLLQWEGRHLLRARHLYQQQILIFSSLKTKLGKKKKKNRLKPSMFIYTHVPISISKYVFFVSYPASHSIFKLTCITFMLLQQLVVELHHLLVLFELQQALAEVEGQRKAHFFQ